MRILAVGRAVRTGAELGRAAAFERVVAELAREHEIARVWSHEGPAPEAPPGTLLVEGRGDGPWVAWAVRQGIRRFDPELLLCAGTIVPPTRRPAVAVVRDLGRTGWETRPAQRLALHRFRVVVVPTSAVRHQLPVDPFRVQVIEDPLPDMVVGSPGGEGLVVVQVGPIHPSRRPHLAIEAVATLSASEKRAVRLIVAGEVRDPRYLAHLRVQAEGQPVELRPDPPSLVPTLAAAHLAVYPSAVDDGWPDAALLPAALGRPVLVSERPTVTGLLGPNARPVAEGVAAWREAIRAGPFPVAPWRGEDWAWRWRQLVRSLHG